MDLKLKIRTYNFWISLAAAILIVLRLVGQSLGFTVDSVLFMDIATAVCGVLVVLGIIIMPASTTKPQKKEKQKEPTECGLKITTEQSEITEDISAEPAIEEVKSEEPEQLLSEIGEDIEERVEEVQSTESIVKLAIEELAKNPEELLVLVQQILKGNK